MSSQVKIPLFPLVNGLFPASLLRLNIFEVRYLDLIKKCEANQTPFGVVFIQEGSEVQAAGKTPRFFDVGTLAQLQKVDRVQPTLFQVACIGTKRFQMANYELGALGVWYANVQYLADDEVIEVPPNLQPVADRLGQIIVRAQQSGHEADLPFAQPYKLDECGWVADRVAELLPLVTQDKHQLLAQLDPKLRLEAVAGHIRF
jgi:uncharacterized protein